MEQHNDESNINSQASKKSALNEKEFQQVKEVLKKLFVERSLKSGVLAERKKKAH